MVDHSQRINRIIGQLKGVQRMIDGKRDCHEILQQFSAIKKAIDSVSKEVVISDICKMIPKTKIRHVQQMMERAISL
jgi:DNA-binding FrmR family transcriptional regulator